MLRIQLVFLLALTLFLQANGSRSVKAQCNDCWLEVRGSEIVNAHSGKRVILRAVGLGGWLIQEGYMLNPGGCDGCPGTQWQMKLQYLNEGKTIEEVEAFYQQWRDNFITEADIDFIADQGFNCVRLPMHYELFLTSEQRAVRNAVITDLFSGHDDYKAALQNWLDNESLFVDDNLEGFRKIDQLIDWCRGNGIYVILDMHAAPGGQGTDSNIADIFHDNNLWLEPVFQDVLNELWLAISNRYKSEPRIAMYEFVNEPNNVPGGGQAIRSLTQRLLTTVRNNGDNHMIGLGGNGWGNNYDWMEPSNFSPNWGLVYTAHRYWIDPADDSIPNGNPNQINRLIDLTNFRSTHNVPVWIGETGENTNDWLAQNIDKLENAGVGWCHWTFKRHDFQENAALMRIGGNYPTDGAFAMPTVLESIKFQNCIPNPNTLLTVTADLPAKGKTGCFATTDNCPPRDGRVWFRASNGGVISSENGDSAMTCNRTTIGSSELFNVIDLGQGRVALQGSNGLFVSSENGEQPMNCNRASIEAWEIFDWVDLGNGEISLRGNNEAFVSSEDGQQPITCNRSVIESWEAFAFGVAKPARVTNYWSRVGTARGHLDELFESNDRGIVAYPKNVESGPGITLEFECRSSTQEPDFLSFKIESSISHAITVQQSLQLYDFESDAWVEVYSGSASHGDDSTIEVMATSPVDRFVDPMTFKSLVRANFETVGGQKKYTAKIDHVAWSIGKEYSPTPPTQARKRTSILIDKNIRKRIQIPSLSR